MSSPWGSDSAVLGRRHPIQDIKRDLYDMAFRQWEMVPSRSASGYGPAGTLYRFRGECGSGEYWAYFHGKLFAINAFDLRFSARGVFRYRHAEHLSIAHYDRTDLDVRSSLCPTGSHVIGTYVADEGAEYVAHCERGAVSRATSITISPDYYRLYLRERFGDIPNIRKAFKLVNGSRDFPALAALFRQRYGCTPAAFVKRIRMERAMELLSDTDLPIRQISRRVGYAKPSAFTKAFSGVTGVLPSAMRD